MEPRTLADAARVVLTCIAPLLAQPARSAIAAGDLAGNLTIGSLDLSRGKRVDAPAAAPAGPAQVPTPTARPRVEDPTLSADGVHFSYGHALLIGVSASNGGGLAFA